MPIPASNMLSKWHNVGMSKVWMEQGEKKNQNSNNYWFHRLREKQTLKLDSQGLSPSQEATNTVCG